MINKNIQRKLSNSVTKGKAHWIIYRYILFICLLNNDALNSYISHTNTCMRHSSVAQCPQSVSDQPHMLTPLAQCPGSVSDQPHMLTPLTQCHRSVSDQPHMLTPLTQCPGSVRPATHEAGVDTTGSVSWISLRPATHEAGADTTGSVSWISLRPATHADTTG